MKTGRREFFKIAGTGAAGLTLLSPLTLSSCATPVKDKKNDGGQMLFIGDELAIADTQYGKVKGFILRDIFQFRGIPYGADTAGPNRFMAPRKPEPWKDTFDAIWWGNSAPQIMENRYANSFYSFRDHWNYDDVSENCLRLNVWTPSVKDNNKRPVLVWLHGGGFVNGNGIEQDGYMGENLSRHGDIVFVSLNHRLGPMGFSDLAGVGGKKYAASGNVGMLDIVAALQWVHDNKSNFGGDPGNVTIIGQSGGGVKVTTLTAMPSAKGLLHKAVVLSGAAMMAGDKNYSEKLGAYILKEAGLKNTDIDKLQQMPWMDYYKLADSAEKKLNEELGPGGNFMRRGFNPVADGTFLPADPYYPEAAPTAADIPMIISSTFNEFYPSPTDKEIDSITLDGVKEKLKGRLGFMPGLGDKAGEVVDAYVKAFPGKKPVEILSFIVNNRKSVVALANAKVKQPAPVYVAWFGWQPPLMNNRMRAFHCLDICFWFYNTDLMLTHTGGGARPKNLSEKMSATLVQFMKTGNPNGGGLPEWPKYTTGKGETMVLNDVSEAKNDPDRDARNLLPA